MSTRTAKCYPHKALEIIEERLPVLPPNGVLVKVLFAGVCHTDISVWHDGYGSGEKKISFSERGFKYPFTPGHEISGTVFEMNVNKNEGCSELCIGDNVLVYPWAGCGECYLCKHGEDNACENPKKETGFDIPGGFAEFVMVPHYSYCIKVPSTIPMEIAALLSCSGVTAYNAVSKGLGLAMKTVAIRGSVGIVLVGAGGLGLWAVKFARILMPANTKIVVADIQDEKIQIAKEAGADGGILWTDVPSDEVVKQTRAACGGYVDVVVDFVNSTKTHEQAIKTIRRGGLVVPVGLFGGESSISLPVMAIHQWNITPIHVGSVNEVKETLKFVQDHAIEPINTVFYKLEQVNEAMQDLHMGKVKGRAILKM